MPENKQEPVRKSTVGSGQRTSSAASALDARLSGPLAPLEKSLDGIFGAKAPYQLSEKARETITKISPWLSLASGILGLLAALGLWQAAHYVNRLVDYTNTFSSMYGYTAPVERLGITFWLSMAMLIVFSALAFLAYPGLKARKKIGWNFMFYSVLASAVYSIVSLFYDGVGSLVGSLVGCVIGLYILFQIRSRYKV